MGAEAAEGLAFLEQKLSAIGYTIDYGASMGAEAAEGLAFLEQKLSAIGYTIDYGRK